MALIGIENLYIAEMLDDNDSDCTYAAPIHIPGLIEINMEPQTNSKTLYADNMAYAVATAMGETKVSINVEDLSDEIHAKLLGHEIKDGVMISRGGDQAPNFAVLFESKKRDGSIKYVKLMKGKFQEPSENPKTSTNEPDFVTPTIEGTFVGRQCDKVWKLTGETSNPNFTKASTWYNSVEGALKQNGETEDNP